MPAGSRHVVRAAAVVLLISLAAPAAAFADGGSTCKASACKVYHEGGAPSGGPKQQPPPKGPTGSNKSGGGQQHPHVSKSKARFLQHLGKDRGPVKNLLAGDAEIGNLRDAAGGGSPSLFGAAFDLGVGPTILLVILLATGLGLAARGSVQSWLRKRSSS
jgi:hypothetical protein